MGRAHFWGWAEAGHVGAVDAGLCCHVSNVSTCPFLRQISDDATGSRTQLVTPAGAECGLLRDEFCTKGAMALDRSMTANSLIRL